MPGDLTCKQENFYAKYEPMEGINTASVLGGFFVFVCLLVLYKSKLKPWWKERHLTRPEATPAERSEGNGSFGQIQRDLECIPLQTIHSELCEEEEEDLFYLDDLGHFVFPTLPPGQGYCSCPQR